MRTAAIICEYNPFHNGHRKQIDEIRRRLGDDTGILCLMSGNYVQRGEPAVFPRSVRTEAALRCGADLVLELPVTYSLRSAEGFAAGAVSILYNLNICDFLSFGSEDPEFIGRAAECALSEQFQAELRSALSEGLSYGAASEKAMKQLLPDGGKLKKPNNILAVEYEKALMKIESCSIRPLPILRSGCYHAEKPEACEPSAEALRNCASFVGFVPEETLAIYQNAVRHTIRAGERGMLSIFRSMTEDEFELLPFSDEGLHHKVYAAVRRGEDYEGVIRYAKSKRYPYTRIARMLMCAFLGISPELLYSEVPYVRVLGFTDRGRGMLRDCRTRGTVRLLNAGAKADRSLYSDLESRCDVLYGLFTEAPFIEKAIKNKILYLDDDIVR